MRLFQHIILDFENSTQTQPNEYWALKTLKSSTSTLTNEINLYKKYSTTYSNSGDEFYQNHKYTVSAPSYPTNLEKLILQSKENSNRSLPTWYNLININFLRKERLYTKLKYSRSPAYDTVSGGAAAIFAGFLGFLVSEKFGMELVDSGDFYFVIMYVVFLSFSIRPLLTVLNPSTPLSEIFSLKPIFTLYSNLFTLLIKKFL